MGSLIVLQADPGSEQGIQIVTIILQKFLCFPVLQSFEEYFFKKVLQKGVKFLPERADLIHFLLQFVELVLEPTISGRLAGTGLYTRRTRPRHETLIVLPGTYSLTENYFKKMKNSGSEIEY